MTDNSNHILIVDDETSIATLLRDYFRAEHFQTHCLHRGDEVMPWLQQQHTDLIVLDLMLPAEDGLSLCRKIRAQSNTPIMMVTARVDEIDRLIGLELGADDYICKPFSPREVVARAKAILRRSKPNNGTHHNPTALRLCQAQLALHWQHKTLTLSTIEFQLLHQLCSKPGFIYSRDKLMDRMYQDHRIVSDRTIDSHIKKLRRKLEEAFPEQVFIESVYGAGYRLNNAINVVLEDTNN